MNKSITIEDLIKDVLTYNPGEVDIIRKAYDLAEKLHNGKNQKRESGEPYIIHPLNVAYILSEMKADRDTICAGLLHDTIEDTDITKEEIEKLFNKDVADLVDGVTKIRDLTFSSEDSQKFANNRKVITSLITDVRIIIIKLADRLHNMRTLEYKKHRKQKEKALETLKIYVPFANLLGAYRIKNELEDLSLKYWKPRSYKKIEEQKYKIEEESKNCLETMADKIKKLMDINNIKNNIKIRTKNVYGIYKKLSEGTKLSNINDLLCLKIIVDNEENCYKTLGYVHKVYHPINEKFKDYICNPKNNMYRSLHTVVFGEDQRLVQIQIRTFDMDKIASFGLTAYWDINKGEARSLMQKDLKDKYKFYKSLIEIDEMFKDNEEFVLEFNREVLGKIIYVYTTKGEIVELPKGSTPIDFAYKIHTDIGNKMVKVIVNEHEVEYNYKLKNKDRIKIITSDDGVPTEEWITIAKTSQAKKKIKEYLNGAKG
jgi:GTP pyrophosphokinase